MTTPLTSPSAWEARLLKLGLAVQARIASIMSDALKSGFQSLAEAVTEDGGDRIYRIDREAESIIEDIIANWPDECLPLLLIAEGMGRDGVERFGPESESTRWRLIVDPIDGTRMLMYDKRSAWFLAAVCPDMGDATTLQDAVASVMVELPTSKQHLADAFVSSVENATRGIRLSVKHGDAPQIGDGEEFQVAASSRTDLSDGFATVLSMFPGTRRLASDLAETIAQRCGVMTSIPTVFDDHYISCGGLFYQLMTGRDLCCIDLRPQFNQILGRTGGDRFIESHPYDLAGLLAASNSGVNLTNGIGRPLNAPLDVETGVDWCGYANDSIRRLVEPIILDWLASHGVASQ